MAEQSGELRRFIGLILVVIGTLWLILTGLCSGVFIVSFLTSADAPPDGEALGMVLAIGIPSALIGGAIYAIGRLLRPSQS